MDPALYKAATLGEVASLRKLVDPEDPSALSSTTPQLNTALHLAALHGHAAFAGEVLVRNEELLVARNDDGDTPLHLAAKAGKLEAAELLVGRALAWPQDRKSPLIMTNKAGNTALHEAVRNRRSAVAEALLDADPSHGHDLNERMESPLHMAAREGLVHVVRKIFDFTWVEAEYVPSVAVSGTALHQAVLGGHTKIVEIMLEKHAWLLDLTDSDGNNALHYAAQKNKSQLVELLLNKQAQLAYKPNGERQTPLHVAAHYGSTAAIKALLRCCPDVAEMVDSCGRNAFHISVASGKTNALRCLLRHVRPAELLNRVDNDGDTPLHLAAKMSRVQSALLLLNDHALVEVKLHAGEMDAYEMYLWKQLKQQELKRCREQQLPPLAPYSSRKTSNDKYFECIVETYILVATLIATVTFAATASIVVVFCFIWAWLDPVRFKVDQLLWGHRLTVIACLAMLVSLMTAVYITVDPESRWPAYVVIVIGMSTPAVVFLMLGKEVIFVPM
ncbi:ankyrin repeat-containing protein At5g02620-like [Panicum hallii]|uniref:ankyrin repeat-containing protein At5g02620-like n=1 Tax=Panicum hallii TaxID=206008 RepID=UPI000DF4D46F|nr:ankyrin repeat-containing protein At5g02620-like [Panicum hallii]